MVWVVMARKKIYKPKSFESTGKVNDTSANIYDSMLMSKSFLHLTKNQRLLYVYMKNQYYGKRKPCKDHPDIEILQGDDLFYFSMGMAEKYGLYKKGSQGQFYKDIRAIEEHGFIKTIVNGKVKKEKSIYCFSDEWKRWNDTS